MNEIKITTPITEDIIFKLKAGDKVLISGTIYTARDTAHKRLYEAIKNNSPLPFDLQGAVIYYAGPTPAPPGRPIGSIGPTTSYRMDFYTPLLLSKGLKMMIGKGKRSDEVKNAIKTYKAVYCAATGGAGALLSLRVKSAKVIAYEDLGPEAIRRLEVVDFPCVVVNDQDGSDLYEISEEKYRIE